MMSLEEDVGLLKRINSLSPNLEGLDPHSRTQPRLHMDAVFPSPEDGTCACGCGKEMKGRRTRWATDECSRVAVDRFFIHKGHSATVRHWLRVRDGGLCVKCGGDGRRKVSMGWAGGWEADHIVPVVLGGGGCGLGGYQTLCTDCHKLKTASMAKARATVRRHELQKRQEVLAL